jgi:serine protease Do
MSGLFARLPGNPARSRHRPWRRLLIAVATVVLSALAVGPVAAQQQPEADQAPPVTNPQARAADLARPAVVWIRVHYDAWVITDRYGTFRERVEAGCSGFIVNPKGYIVTAGHCLQDGMDGAQGDAITQVVDRLVAAGVVSVFERERLIEDIMVGNIDWQVEGDLNNSRPDRTVHVVVGGGNVKFGKPDANGGKPARVVEALEWKDGDVALLKLQRNGLPSILLSQIGDIQVGEELLSIGYPADAEEGESFGLTNRNGQINSEVNKGSSGVPFYETSARLTPGMSGCPTVNLNGEVVGLASFRNEDANYIVPSSIILELLNRNGVKNELGQLDNLYRQGLENYYRREYSAAIKNFDQVLALMPGHKLAAATRAKAAQLRERFGDPAPPPETTKSGGSTTLLLAGAGTVLVVLAVTVALVLRRRPRRGHRRGRGGPDLPRYTTGMDGSAGALPASAEMREQPQPEVSRGPAQAARSGVVGDPYLGDGDLREEAHAPVAVTVWDPEATPERQLDPEPARRNRNFCSNCGTKLSPDDRFCPQCGASQD